MSSYGWGDIMLDTNNSAITAAEISIIGTILSGAIAWLVATIKCNNDRSMKYKEIITVERVKWLNKVRENMAMCTEAAYQLKSECCNKESDSLKMAKAMDLLCQNLDLLILMYTHSEEDFVTDIKKFKNTIEDKADEMYGISHLNKPGSLESIDIKEDISTFTQRCQQILKRTWEQIKEEAT
ncbi:hypothetical protein J2S01_001802 [Pectinatus haikarae]|uniref:Uncharacterized protein n=2 Tax=Pectinatus haikarae TaxID=349096 RepID=A0ABT9Y8B7_9FIRM|nr:hypothetical protein [Pectinatus haikarae]